MAYKKLSELEEAGINKAAQKVKVQQEEKKKQISLYLPIHQYEFLKKLKEEELISASQLIKQLLKAYMEEREQ